MLPRNFASAVNSEHRFGGDWTEKKLAVLEKYLAGYTTALKHQPNPQNPFRKAYIDAFAGTGYRTPRQQEGIGNLPLVFPDLAEEETQKLLEGSATRALRVQPRFDRYIFIERDADRCAQLEELKRKFPDLAADIRVENGEANAKIQELCTKVDWKSRRAVLFLDPYGMEVEWQTIEAVANTKAIDLWLLFPLGMGVNRLLTKTGEIPPAWRKRLDVFLGTENWYDEFYQAEPGSLSLFGNEEDKRIKVKMEAIARYFTNRLKKIFPGVAEPGILRNRNKNPLYLLCFAAANEKGADPALRIANHLLKGIR